MDEDKDVRIYSEKISLAKVNKDNLKGKISLILLNMPEDVSDLAKVRYIYKKFGSMFCYDYGIITDEEIAGVKVNYENIDKFQTCGQIAEILATALKGINGNVETRIIPRKANTNTDHKYEHMATEVKFHDRKDDYDYKLLLDLTLDLYRIQAGMQTRQFAFTTDESSSYDIISLRECEELDKQLGLYDEMGGYLDTRINEVKNELAKSDLNTLEKLRYVWNKLGRTFSGPHEARLYFENLIRECVPNCYYKVFNMYYEDVSRTEFESLFIISSADAPDIYLLVDNNVGVVKTDLQTVNNMFKLGWESTSNSIKDVLGEDPYEEGRVYNHKKS